MGFRSLFCPNDKTLLRKTPEGGFLCPKCGYRSWEKVDLVVRETPSAREIPVVDSQEDRIELLPTTTAHCEKCGNSKAYYYFRQTRAADEATTRFLECTSCGHRWRDYR